MTVVRGHPPSRGGRARNARFPAPDGAADRRARRRGGAGAAAAALGLVLLSSACSTENDDPRALPETASGESMEKVLQAFELELPPCEIEEVGWSGASEDWGKSLQLRFRAPDDCVDEFLESHGAELGEGLQWPFGEMTVDGEKLSPTRPPLREKDMEKFGLDPGRQAEYTLYDFRTPAGALLDALVDRHGKGTTVYLTSVSSGSA
jgi:hypothetical protein